MYIYRKINDKKEFTLHPKDYFIFIVRQKTMKFPFENEKL